ncbi:uncharacterized protein LOC111114472 isoform X2 [Crassostrea virginica]
MANRTIALILSLLLIQHQWPSVHSTPACFQLRAAIVIFATVVFSADYAAGYDFPYEKLPLFIAAYLLARCPAIPGIESENDIIDIPTTTPTPPPTTTTPNLPTPT